jgi:hypothetical protein
MSMVRSTPTSGLTPSYAPASICSSSRQRWSVAAMVTRGTRRRTRIPQKKELRSRRAACLAPSAVVSSVALLEPSLLRPTIHKGLCLLPRALFEQIVMVPWGKSSISFSPFWLQPP